MSRRLRWLAALVLVVLSASVLPAAGIEAARCGARDGVWSLGCSGERASGELSVAGAGEADLRIENTVSGLTSSDPVIQFLLDVTGLSRGYSQWLTLRGTDVGARCQGICLGGGASGQDTILLADSSADYALSAPGGAAGELAVDARPTSATTVVDVLMIVAAAIVPGGHCGAFISPQAMVELAAAAATAVGPSASALRVALRAAEVRQALDALADIVPSLVHTLVVFAARRGLSGLALCLAEATADAVLYSVLWAKVLLAVAPLLGLVIAHYRTLTAKGIAPTVITARRDADTAAGSATAGTAGGTATAGGTPTLRPTPEPSVTTVVVPGSAVWFDTGLDAVSPGALSFAATGVVFIAGSDPGKSPDGAKDCVAAGDSSIPPGPFLAPGLPCWSLVGKIGDGLPFEIGSSSQYTSSRAGRLFLAINDSRDNRGSFTVEIGTGSGPIESGATAQVTVEGGHPGWTETGLFVHSGDRLQFRGSGEISWDPAVSEPRVGPAGASWMPNSASNPSEFLLPDAAIASLIGKVGDNVFEIGSQAVLAFDQPGALSLGMNERWVDGAWDDNGGSRQVTIDIVLQSFHQNDQPS